MAMKGKRRPPASKESRGKLQTGGAAGVDSSPRSFLGDEFKTAAPVIGR